jgi:hypothetical protein
MSIAPEVETALPLLVAAVDRVVAAAADLDAEALNWRPLPGASSLAALGLHVLGMTRENVMTHICRVQSSDRVRAREFEPADESGESLAARWAALRPDVETALTAFPAEQLGDPRNHQTFGEVPARELLQRLVAHAHEHAGHAELTRQLLVERPA